MNPDQEYVLKTIKARDVSFVRFWFTDVLGRVKSFAVSPNELEDAFEEGMVFNGGNIAGFAAQDAGETDMLAFPDASTFQVLPWRPDANAVARMFCTIYNADGQALEACPRRILSRTMERLAQAGYNALVAPEVEYFYFRDATGTELLDHGSYFDLNTLDSATDLRRDTVLSLEKMGIPVEYSHHETGPSQHEIDLRPSDALAMADAVQTYKMVVKETAALHGVFASFMPKPLSNIPGSGMHVHLSLFDEAGNNVFFDETDSSGLNLSPTGKSFVAGLVHYAPELSLLTNQYVNSYKRIASGEEAPTHANWGREGKSTLVRVPVCMPGNDASCQVELRNPDPACNPYLAFAAMLAAGLAGLQEGLQLNASEQAAPPLPSNLGEAIRLFEQSQLAREILGNQTHAFLVHEKTNEWEEYSRKVTDWELQRFLEVL